MFANPFATLSASISPIIMQAYVLAMIALVAAGTLYDVVHKKSARYFFENWRSTKSKGTQRLSGADMLSQAAAAAGEGLVSGEFCNARRRIAHLLTMYGFLAYVITTAILVFEYPAPETPAPAIVPALRAINPQAL